VDEDLSRWILKVRMGDSSAFTHLVETFQRPVYNLCYRMLGNAQDAEDAAQETFLRAYKNLNRYDENRSFSTWLLSVAAHYCIDQIRRRRYPIVSVEELPRPDLPDLTPGLESRLSRKEEQNRVREILNVLEPIDRAAVILYYWYDYSYQEICQSLSLSASAVKSRLHRARRAMAQSWLEKQPQTENYSQASRNSNSTESLRVERITP